MLENYKKIIGVLNKLSIPHTIVGGVAACMSGYPRATLSADILIKLSPDDYDNLLEPLEEISKDVKVYQQDFEGHLGDYFVVTIDKEIVRLCCAKWGWEHDALKNCKTLNIENNKMKFPNLEYVIILRKKQAQFPNNNDIKNFSRYNNVQIDHKLLAELQDRYLE